MIAVVLLESLGIPEISGVAASEIFSIMSYMILTPLSLPLSQLSPLPICFEKVHIRSTRQLWIARIEAAISGFVPFPPQLASFATLLPVLSGLPCESFLVKLCVPSDKRDLLWFPRKIYEILWKRDRRVDSYNPCYVVFLYRNPFFRTSVTA